MSSKTPARNRRGHKVERATWLLAIFTGIVAIFTAALAIASFWTVREERRASSEQLGVQTWLYVDPRFDSKELRLARKKLAQQLDPKQESFAAATLDRHDGIVRRNLGMNDSEPPISPLNLSVLSQNTIISIDPKELEP
jgi:hypothetical protein